MSPINIIRAWKDAEYRQSLSAADLALLPAHPAGLIQLTDDDLDSIAGGRPKLTEGVCRHRRRVSHRDRLHDLCQRRLPRGRFKGVRQLPVSPNRWCCR